MPYAEIMTRHIHSITAVATPARWGGQIDMDIHTEHTTVHGIIPVPGR